MKTTLRKIEAHHNTQDFVDNNYLAYYAVSLYHWSSLGIAYNWDKNNCWNGSGNRLPVGSNPQVAPHYHLWSKALLIELQPLLREQGEILSIIPNRYCRGNAGCPVHSSPQRKFQKCAARGLIRPDLPEPYSPFSQEYKNGLRNHTCSLGTTSRTLMARCQSLTPLVDSFNQTNNPQSYHNHWCSTKKIEVCSVLHYAHWRKWNWTESFNRSSTITLKGTKMIY